MMHTAAPPVMKKKRSLSGKKSAGETEMPANQPKLNSLDHTLGRCG
jgi:hypothetical protein